MSLPPNANPTKCHEDEPLITLQVLLAELRMAHILSSVLVELIRRAVLVMYCLFSKFEVPTTQLAQMR
jgi:hypothetical protein